MARGFSVTAKRSLGGNAYAWSSRGHVIADMRFIDLEILDKHLGEFFRLSIIRGFILPRITRIEDGLVNAFERPVPERAGEGVLDASIVALAEHWGQMVDVYGEPGDLGAWYISLDPALPAEISHARRVDSSDELVGEAVQAAMASTTA